MGSIRTVTGEISPEKLGTTLMHEHIIIDLSSISFKRQESTLANSKVSKEIRSRLMESPLACIDNLRLSEVKVAAEELSHFKKSGGRAVVDQTCIGMGRDPMKLREISKSSGVYIISSTGWYTEPSHTSIVKEADVETLAKTITDEISVGIDGTGIKAGLIGEVGCSVPLRENEGKVLRAAGRAQAETGAAISVHPGNIDHQKKVWVKEGLQYLDIVSKQGADPARFILSHSDHPLDRKYHQKLLDEGVTLSFDGFGQEFSYGGLSMPNDNDIVSAIAEFCSNGYDGQIVLSHDVWMKVQLKSFGGLGYQHLMKSVVPGLEDAGVTKKQIQKMLVENPRRLLSF